MPKDLSLSYRISKKIRSRDPLNRELGSNPCLGQIPRQGMSKLGKTRGAQLLGTSSMIFRMDQQKGVTKNSDFSCGIREKYRERWRHSKKRCFGQQGFNLIKSQGKTNSSFDLVFHLTSKYDLKGERGMKIRKKGIFYERYLKNWYGGRWDQGGTRR